MEIHDWKKMEGFQVKEKNNTFVEQKAKESPFEICQEVHVADRRRLGKFLCSVLISLFLRWRV